MKRMALLLIAFAAGYVIIGLASPAAGHVDDQTAPIFGIKIPSGYRDWPVVSVAHEEGTLNDLRAVLGNEAATKAYREGKLPFPDGTIIARVVSQFELFAYFSLLLIQDHAISGIGTRPVLRPGHAPNQTHLYGRQDGCS